MSIKFLVSLFEYKAWCNRNMFEALRRVPQGEHPVEMVIMTLTLDHVATVDQIFKAHLIGEPHSFDGVVSRIVPTLDALSDKAAATDRWFIDYVGSASEAELSEGIDFTFVSDGMAGHMTRAEMLGHVLTHGNSHRGAVGKMLSDLKVQGPADMFTTFLHREPAKK